jgi:predicted N-formylglutamate amidohydrolase
MNESLLGPTDPAPVAMINRDGAAPFVLTCDHAGWAVPAALDNLGLPDAEMNRHIAYDIGAADLARKLAARLDAPLIMQSYSRLVIDCNRHPNVAESVIVESDGTLVPANQTLGETERTQRVEEIHRPYHDAIRDSLESREESGHPTILLSVHSCTPAMNGFARPWHAGLLYNRDPRFCRALMPILQAAAPGLTLAFNQPYTVDDESDYTIPVHGEGRGLHHGLVEIRNDQLVGEEGLERWADLLAASVSEAARAFLNELEEK